VVPEVGKLTNAPPATDTLTDVKVADVPVIYAGQFVPEIVILFEVIAVLRAWPVRSEKVKASGLRSNVKL
jgi:hypothetical protein